jgi:hypothetical protein
MSTFHTPIPRDNYCRVHGIAYTGYICPECAVDRAKEMNNRVCPACQQPRVVNVKYIYCANSKCVQFLIMYRRT